MPVVTGWNCKSHTKVTGVTVNSEVLLCLTWTCSNAQSSRIISTHILVILPDSHIQANFSRQTNCLSSYYSTDYYIVPLLSDHVSLCAHLVCYCNRITDRHRLHTYIKQTTHSASTITNFQVPGSQVCLPWIYQLPWSCAIHAVKSA